MSTDGRHKVDFNGEKVYLQYMKYTIFYCKKKPFAQNTLQHMSSSSSSSDDTVTQTIILQIIVQHLYVLAVCQYTNRVVVFLFLRISCAFNANGMTKQWRP